MKITEKSNTKTIDFFLIFDKTFGCGNNNNEEKIFITKLKFQPLVNTMCRYLQFSFKKYLFMLITYQYLYVKSTFIKYLKPIGDFIYARVRLNLLTRHQIVKCCIVIIGNKELGYFISLSEQINNVPIGKLQSQFQ